MRIPRFYHPAPIIVDQLMMLEKCASQHITRVLRMKIQEPVLLFHDGVEYMGLIENIDHHVCVKIIERHTNTTESPLCIHLAQGLARADKMDFILQKATELGVSHITPLITERSIVKLKPDQYKKKREHWHNIIISAAQQCGRNTLPILADPIEYKKFLHQPVDGAKIILDPQATQKITSIAPCPIALCLLIGPESGFSETEIDLAKQQQYGPYHLGPRILRTETATISALSILQALYGDL